MLVPLTVSVWRFNTRLKNIYFLLEGGPTTRLDHQVHTWKFGGSGVVPTEAGCPSLHTLQRPDVLVAVRIPYTMGRRL